jgi:hypothetical protein
MTRSIQQIKQEIDRIEAKVIVISEQIYQNYSQYLDLFNQVVAQQFILAAYQICTQIYPNSFVQLSFSQRESLQQKLRKINQENFRKLLEYFSVEENNLKLNNPVELREWQDNIEQSIILRLEEISKMGNSCLQKAGILPEKIPNKVLEMAIEAEENIPTTSSSANLLNLLIETGEIEKEGINQITVLRLRLSDIEFSESSLINQRNKIREIKEQINQLNQKYQRQIKELTIAEAEAAWRSSWHL